MLNETQKIIKCRLSHVTSIPAEAHKGVPKQDKCPIKWSILVSVTKSGWGRVPRLAPLAQDFILLGQKLEKLGFSYSKGRVIIVLPV